MLIANGIIPVIVFDGANLPMKALTEKDRLESRRARKAKGLDFLKAGDLEKAGECFRTCIDVTPLMAYEFIKVLKANSIEFVVAPYEADAQLAFMNLNGMISAVLTEDSDLLSFGCTKVLYKLDQSGHCIEILQSDLGNVKEMKYWTPSRFREMCILAGCDYLPNLPGIGVKTAIKHLERVDVYSLIKSWQTWGTAVKAPKMPKDYLHRFQLADYTFQFQRVYDPKKQRLVTLRPIPSSILITSELMNAIGPDYDPLLAKGVAEGSLNPDTKLAFPLNDVTRSSLQNSNRLVPNSSSNISKPSDQGQKRTNPFKPTNSHTPVTIISSSKTPNDMTLKFKNKPLISQNPPSYSSVVATGAIKAKSPPHPPSAPQAKEEIIIITKDDDEDVKFIEAKTLQQLPLQSSNPPFPLQRPPPLSRLPGLKSIRSTHTKTVLSGVSKIVPARRKADAVNTTKQYPQKKILNYFGKPRLSHHFPPPSNNPPLLATKIISENAIVPAAQHSRPVGILNLLKPPKPRRVGLAPLKKKAS